jgi:hypothetical protein
MGGKTLLILLFMCGTIFGFSSDIYHAWYANGIILRVSFLLLILALVVYVFGTILPRSKTSSSTIKYNEYKPIVKQMSETEYQDTSLRKTTSEME